MTKKNLVGLTGERVSYYDPGNNNWAIDINNSLQAIADSLDIFIYGIEDVSREAEAAAGRRFQELQDELAVFVALYLTRLDTVKTETDIKLQTYIKDNFETASLKFISESQRDLATVLSIKDMVTEQIKFIDESIKFLKIDFNNNTDRFVERIIEASDSRDDVLTNLNTDVSDAESTLINHIADKNNPHNTTTQQLENAITVYQLDPDNNTSLIEPAILDSEKKVVVDPDLPVLVPDDPLALLGKVIGIGDYASNLTTGLFAEHYYLEFDAATDDVVDSIGDAATYILSGGKIIITWDGAANKRETIWEVTYSTSYIRLSPIQVIVKNATSLEAIRQDEGFQLYFADDPYPQILALFMGNEDTDLYIVDGTDDTLNWAIDVDDAPTIWDTPVNLGTPNPDYYIQGFDIEPDNLDKLALEGRYFTLPSKWPVSAYSIETSGFVNIPDLATFNYWGRDANGIYLRAKFDATSVTFLYNMFERVLLPATSSSSSGGLDSGYEDLTVLSYFAQCEWVFPSPNALEIGDTINVETKRREIQGGADVAGTTVNGSFTISQSFRYDR